jgi:hypothetical protein
VGSDCGPDVLEADGTPCGDGSDTDCTDPDDCQAGVCEPNHEPITTECRAASPGQLCDEPENCDGAGNCPADLPKANGVECRAASLGQDCDEAEVCDGVLFQCPPDVPKDLGDVCRPAAGDCDVQEECDGESFDCPPDTIRPDGFVCRADAGECDIAEECDGVTTACPANAFEDDGTSCTDDGLHCTGVEECQGGSCVGDGDPCTVGVCDEVTNQCIAAGCETAPLAGCRLAGKSILVIKDNSDNTKDKLVYKWLKGALPSVQADYADPTDTADYTLCIYTGASPTLVAEADVAPGGTCSGADCWKPISTKGYKFKDKPGTQDGVTKIILKSNANPGKSKALVKGKGTNLPDIPDAAGHPTVDLDLPVKVQLVNEDNGNCWQSDFDTGDIKKNVPGKFKGKAQ